MKTTRGLALMAVIPVLAACGSGTKTAQIAISSSYSVAPSSTSHAPTSTKATPNTSKPVTTTPVPVATPSTHVQQPAPHNVPVAPQVHTAAPTVTPAPQSAPATHAPATTAPAKATATPSAATTPQPASTPAKSVATATPHRNAPVVVPVTTPSATASDAKNFTAALVMQNGKGKGSPTKRLGNGTWTVYVTGINATSVTVSVLGNATGQCTDDCLVPIGTQVIPLASTNIPTIMPVKNPTSTKAGFPGITAPAWAYAEIFNQGQVGLNKAVADKRYTISPALKAQINPTFAATSTGQKSVYSDITIKNGVVTNLEWTFHP